MGEFEGLEKLTVNLANYVATITINNPPVNGQDQRFREELVRVFDLLAASENVWAIILTSEERAFSADADLKQQRAIEGGLGAHARHNRLVRAGLDAVMDCPKPAIAAVTGSAIGGVCARVALRHTCGRRRGIHVDDGGRLWPGRRGPLCHARIQLVRHPADDLQGQANHRARALPYERSVYLRAQSEADG